MTVPTMGFTFTSRYTFKITTQKKAYMSEQITNRPGLYYMNA